MKISIANDHAGYDLKNIIIEKYNKEIEIIDCGTNDKQSCDYPDYAHQAISHLVDNDVEFTILICGSGVGMSMCANRWREVRAALCWNAEIVKLSRQHNNANVLCLPARFITEEEAINMVNIFMETQFEGGRHQQRIIKITPTF